MPACNCDTCKEIKAYEKAVEKNNKKYLLKHFDKYLSVCQDLDWLEMKIWEINKKGRVLPVNPAGVSRMASLLEDISKPIMPQK